MKPFVVVRITLEPVSNVEVQSSNALSRLAPSFWNQEQQSIKFEGGELCGSDLYIGLSDGTVAHYSLGNLLEKDSHVNSMLLKRIVVGRTSCTKIVAVPSESKLLVLSDAALNFYNLDHSLTQTNISPLKGVLAFCMDKNIKSPIGLSVSSRRGISYFELDEKLNLKKNIPMEGGAVMLSQYWGNICAADTKVYNLVSLKSNKINPLFPYDSDVLEPIVINISENEFLLVTASAQGFGIGVFISSNGDPIRGTLQWPVVPISIEFQYPYIISLLKNASIQVHNLETQNLVQSIDLPTTQPPKFLTLASYPMDLNSEIDGKTEYGGAIQVIIGTSTDVLGLMMLPWDVQLEELFDSNHIEEAVVLLDKMSNGEESQSQLQRRAVFHIRAALYYLENVNYEKALDHFQRGNVDPRLLIALYDIKPEKDILEEIDSPLLESVVKLESIDNIIKNYFIKERRLNGMKSKQEMIDSTFQLSNKFLIDYLEYARPKENFQYCREHIDTALFKLYTIVDMEYLYQLISAENHCNTTEFESFLEKHKKFYALSLIYKKQNLSKNVLDLWIKITLGEYVDPDFKGISEIVDYLKVLDDKDVVLKYSNWVLRRDPSRGIFTQRNDNLFGNEEVLDYLETFGSKARRKYLEHLILEKSVNDISLNTKLATIYLEDVIRLSTPALVEETENLFLHSENYISFINFLERRRDPFCLAKLHFFHFTKNSEVDHTAILDLLKSQPLPYYFEKLALIIKEKNIEEITTFFVRNINDPVGAYEYIIKREADIKYIQQLIEECLKAEHRTELDIIWMLESLPGNWSVGIMENVLQWNGRKLARKRNSVNMDYALVKVVNLNARKELLKAQQRAPVIIDNTLCSKCKLSITPGNFVELDGKIIHFHCK
ncbi:transforming growth factor, beta receptor associated protein 1 [Boothiomyces sp. JEL0866]|nr:transforming growth factor, beta receptor associated protein 1 [Boothiomyces sp. JEL0866]